MAYKMLAETYMEDGSNYVQNTKMWTSLRNGCFIGVLILVYLFGIIRFINNLKYKIWQTKGLLNIIPTKFLLTNANFKTRMLVTQ